MKYQTQFSGKNEKNILKLHLLKFLPSMQSIKKLQNGKLTTILCVIGIEICKQDY